MHFWFSIRGWRAGERKDVLCNCPRSLSHKHTHTHTRAFSHTHKTHTSLSGKDHIHTHTHSKHEYKMTIQTEKTKMASYVSYILVSNKRQLVQTVYYWHNSAATHQPLPVAHTHSQKYSLLTNPICFLFFVVFLISFF